MTLGFHIFLLALKIKNGTTSWSSKVFTQQMTPCQGSIRSLPLPPIIINGWNRGKKSRLAFQRTPRHCEDVTSVSSAAQISGMEVIWRFTLGENHYTLSHFNILLLTSQGPHSWKLKLCNVFSVLSQSGYNRALSYGIGMCVNMSRQYMGQTSADTDTGPKPETQN